MSIRSASLIVVVVALTIATAALVPQARAETADGKTSKAKSESASKTKAKAKAKTKTKAPAPKTTSKATAQRTTRKPVTTAKATKAAKATARKATAPKSLAARAKEKPKPIVLPPPKGKIAVFVFDGDGAAPVRRRVVSLLRAKGLTVTTTLRPVDSAEQYREMAAALGLAAYVDGEVSDDGDQSSATVQIRSGVTGLRVASATVSGPSRTLPGDVGKTLWERIGADLARVCSDAAKPRKPEHAPMRIDAGKPLEDRPAAPEAISDDDENG